MREALRDRLGRMGASVRFWAGSVAAAELDSSSSSTLPPDTDFVLLHGRKLSSVKLLLPALVKKVSALVTAAKAAVDSAAAPPRDWRSRPLYICDGEECVRWLEAANGLPLTLPLAANSASASSRVAFDLHGCCACVEFAIPFRTAPNRAELS